MKLTNPRILSLFILLVLLNTLLVCGQEFSPQSAMADSFSDYSYSSQFPAELFWGSRWVKGTLADCAADEAVAVNYNIPNGRLEISPKTNLSGTHINGLRSKWKMNFQNGYVQTEALPSNALATAELTVGADCGNWFRIQRRGGTLLFQSKSGSGTVATYASLAYSATAHKYWRIRHNPASNAVVFETGEAQSNTVNGKAKEKRVIWTQRAETVVNFSLAAVNFSLAAGTDSPIAGAETVNFDNFLFTSNNPVARLPVNKIDTAFPATGGTVRNVTVCSQLQTAVNDAQPGDTISVSPSLTCTGNLVFPAKNNPGNKWIVFRSASPEFDFSGAMREGRRVNGDNLQHTAQMPKLRTGNRSSVISFQPGANYYRVVGIDVGIDANYLLPTYEDVYALLGMDKSANQVNHVTIDRCYIHGELSLQKQARRAIALNGAYLAVIDSYIVRIFDKSSQAQGIAAWSGTGPLKIENNRLESTAQDILLGGDGSATPVEGLSDIVIRRNYFYKSPELFTAYPGEMPPVNGIEIKQGIRVQIYENFFEQTVGGVYVKSTYENGCPFCLTENITVQNNKFKNVRSWFASHGGEIGSSGVGYYPQSPNHLTIENNLAYFTNQSDYLKSNGASTRDDVADVRIIHNTYESENNFFTRNTSPNAFNFEMRDNIYERRAYGIGPDEGVASLNNSLFPYTFRKNVLVNNSESTDQPATDSALLSSYPCTAIDAFCSEAGTYIASAWDTADSAGDQVGFVEGALASRRAKGNYRLASGSIYKNAGTDGKDIGVNQDTVDASTAGYSNGIWVTGGTIEEIAPVLQKPFSGSIPNIPATIEVENFDNGGEGISFHDTFGDTGSSVYRTSAAQSVDIQARSGVSNGYNVFEAAAGEWLEYTVNVPSARKYNIGIRYASEFNGGKIRLEDCGSNPDNNNCTDLTGTLPVDSTGGWTSYKNVVRQGVRLSAGIHVLRLVMAGNAADGCRCIVGNFDSIVFNTARFDYNNDGRTDCSVFRPTERNWYWSDGSGYSSATFGLPTDISVPSDYDGDGKTDIAVFRPSTGVWFWINSGSNQYSAIRFGISSDVIAPADYDGDGKTDIAVYRRSTGVWYWINSGSNQYSTAQFGISEDIPVPGDYDGDGKADIGVFRPSSGVWYLLKTTEGYAQLTFGMNKDVPTPATGNL